MKGFFFYLLTLKTYARGKTYLKEYGILKKQILLKMNHQVNITI